MKIFKDLISLVMLFFMLSTNAKRTSSSIQPQVTPTTVKQPTIQSPTVRQPSIQQPATPSFASYSAKATNDTKTTAGKLEQSYKDLVNYVKNAPNVWDLPNGQLNPEFISIMIQKTRQLNLDTMQLQALLETARDIHAVFSGDRTHDIAILNWVNHQIREALNQR